MHLPVARTPNSIVPVALVTLVAVLLLCGLFFAPSPTAGARKPEPGPSMPPVDKLIGPERCGECHRAEYASWRQSQHQTGFKGMHRTAAAKSIAKSLGIKRIKSDPSCVRCHYTPVEKRGKVRAGHGVSCESCHGAAHDWLVVHDDFGGKEITSDLETAEHKKWRVQECRERGMRRPDDAYHLAAQCFECHVISDENLINKTDHPVGDQFEFLSWAQGEVRHNFLASKGAENHEPTVARKRYLFVIGCLLDVEYALRAYAVSTTDGKYRQACAKRVAAGVDCLIKIDGKLTGQPFAGLCAALREKPLAEFSPDQLFALAEQTGTVARALSSSTELSAEIDPLLPTTDKYRGKSLAGQ
ncbi:MAG: multiheme c-type cytochrome [Planctomycetota bacterium]